MKKEIKFSDGEIVALKLTTVDVAHAKKVLHKHTGLKFGKGNYIVQAVGIMAAWMCCHTPDDENTPEVLRLCTLMAAQQHIKDYGGSLALTEDKSEALVYVPDPKGHYVIRVQKEFRSIAIDGNPAPEDEVFIPVSVSNNTEDKIEPKQIMNKEAEKPENTVDHATGAGILLDTLVKSSAEVGIKIYNSNKSKQPQFLIYSKPLRGTSINSLYEGTDLNEAIAILKRATVFTTEQQKDANLKLPKGYNLVPLVDGNFALVNEHNKMEFGGKLEECFKEIEKKEGVTNSTDVKI